MNAVGAECAEAQGIGDGGIHAAADEEEDVAAGGGPANVFFDGEYLAGGVPILDASADVEHEVGEDGLAARRVGDFGMKLDAVEAVGGRSHGGDRAGGGGGENVEALRRLGHQIAVAHPDLLAAGNTAKEGIEGGAGAGQIELGDSVFSAIAFLDGTAQKMSHELLSVTDSENRSAGGEQCGIDGGAAGVVDAGRAAGNDDAFAAS